MNAPIDARSRFIADLAEALDMPDATPAALLREVVALKARTQPATDADLAEVERLDAAATLGPWRVEHDSDDREEVFDHVHWPFRLHAPDRVVVDFTGGHDTTNSDADFIAAARALLPTLAADLANCRRLIRQHKAAAMGTDSRAAWEVAEELWKAVP